jgi:NAD(P)H dehydrogenase (quinone)
MRVLVVYCHPVPDSFCAAMRTTIVDTLGRRGHDVDLIDLYGEKFDPVLGSDERRAYNDGAPADPALAPHIERLRWAEAVVFVYPTWWYGLPAMLKGWLDRVWAMDVVFRLSNEGRARIVPLMEHVRLIGIVTTCGAPFWWSVIVGQPGRKTILRGLRALCGWRCRTFYLAHYLMDSSTDETRRAFLEKVRRRVERL